MQRVCLQIGSCVSLLTILCTQSREGVSLILSLIRQARMQPMHLGASCSSFLESHRLSSGWTSFKPDALEPSAYGDQDDAVPTDGKNEGGWFGTFSTS